MQKPQRKDTAGISTRTFKSKNFVLFLQNKQKKENFLLSLWTVPERSADFTFTKNIGTLLEWPKKLWVLGVNPESGKLTLKYQFWGQKTYF